MRKQQLKGVIIMIALVCLLRIHPTFAAGETPTDTSWITELLNTILKFLSRGWMLLAFLAGKLMSNDFIYGTFIHLDSALFKLWNYMKNVANFMLGFLFLFGILKAFFTEDAFELKKVLPRYLLAGVLIQMSRFIMGAFVDIANIATAAVGAFPTQFIQGSTQNLSKNKMMQLAVTVPERVDVSFKNNEPLIKTHTGTQTIEDMFGKFNDMSGPLMFMGASIFRFQDYDIVNADITSRKNFSIGLFIKLFLLVAFCVPMLVLIVVNLIRIFRLWIWIAFAPLAAIAWSFDDKSTPGVVKTAGEKLGFGKISDVLSLIFQPVVMIGSLALVMILSIGMYYVLGGDPGNQQSSTTFSETIENVQIEAEGQMSTLRDLNSGTEVSVEGNLFKDVGNFVGGMIGYLIITGFTVVLIWSLIKIGASFSKFTKGAAENIFKWSEKLVTNAQIIPIGGQMSSIAAWRKAKEENMRSIVSGGYNAQRIDDQKDRIVTGFFNKTGAGQAAKKIFGIKDKDIGNTDISMKEQQNLILSASGGAQNMLEQLRELLAKKKISAQSSNFRSTFSEMMVRNQGFRDFILRGAGITDIEEWNKNQKDILNAPGQTGAKVRKFLAYALNNKDVQASDQKFSERAINEAMLKKFGNSGDFLPATPFMAEAANSADDGEKAEK